MPQLLLNVRTVLPPTVLTPLAINVHGDISVPMPSLLHHRARLLAIVMVALLPLVMGGDMHDWVRGVMFVYMGVLYVVFPPRHAPKKTITGLCLGLFAVGLTSFLPARWFGIPEWRNNLIADLGLDLPSTLSAQPWLSLDYLTLLGVSLLFLHYLVSQHWERPDRVFLMRVLAGGLVAFCGASILFYLLEDTPGLWQGANHFGPLGNRNHTALALAMGAMAVTGCAYYEFQKDRLNRAALWSLALPVLFAAIVINGSRAGVLLFFGGMALWILYISYRRKSPALLAVAGSGLLILVASFFLYGGKTLERFSVEDDSVTATLGTEARPAVYLDALVMSSDSPLFGVGLGNFNALFPLFREHSLSVIRYSHPENDWLWLLTEMGVAGLIIGVLLLLVLLKEAFPFSTRRRSRRSEDLRACALIAVLLLLAHSQVSVPGHRVGIVPLALLLFALALRRRKSDRNHPGRSLLLPWFYRVAGVALACLGAAWIAAVFGDRLYPGPIGVESVVRRTRAAEESQDYAQAYALMGYSISFEPLRWKHYFRRGRYAALGARSLEEAKSDFRIAGHLEPQSSAVPVGEARFWLTLRPRNAVPALREAIRRQPSLASHYLRLLFQSGKGDPSLVRELRSVALLDAESTLTYLSELHLGGKLYSAQVPEFFDEILRHDPDLAGFDNRQKTRLFYFYYRSGGRSRFMELMEKHPEWQEAGWRQMCAEFAYRQDFASALATANHFLKPPSVPRLSGGRSAGELKKYFFANPADAALGLQLFEAEMQGRNVEAAISTLRKVVELPKCPSYALYLLAQALEETGRLEEAWSFLSRYLQAAR